MTIEQQLSDILKELQSINGKLIPTVDATPVIPAPVTMSAVQAPAAHSQEWNASLLASSVTPVGATPSMQMPPPPVFEAPPVAQLYKNVNEFTTYVTTVLQQIGMGRASEIQAILNAAGYMNIKDVKDTDFMKLHAQIEALKG